MRLLIVSTLFFISFGSYALQHKGIEVTGKGSVMVMPDTFSLTISINERGKSASKTKAVVDKKSQTIVSMFLKEGVNQAAINSSQVRMFPIYEKPSITFENIEYKKKIKADDKISLPRTNIEQSKIKRLTRFEVSRTIKISFKQLSLYDRVLDQVVKLGVSHISPLEMSISEPENHYRKAITQAITDAKLKAQNIAKNANIRLGQIVSVKESGYHAPARYRMASDISEGFSSQVTEKSISAQVITTFSIQTEN